MREFPDLCQVTVQPRSSERDHRRVDAAGQPSMSRPRLESPLPAAIIKCFALLTEDALMLNEQDLQRFQQLLVEFGARIRSDYQHLTDEALEAPTDSRSPTHLAELGTDAYEQEFSLRFAESDQHVLEEIDAALKRIKEG